MKSTQLVRDDLRSAHARCARRHTDPRIQRLYFQRNAVTHSVAYSSSVVLASGVDSLVVTDNDSNYSGSLWVNPNAYVGSIGSPCSSVTAANNK